MTATMPENSMHLLEAVQRTGAGAAFEKALLYSKAATDAVVDTRAVEMTHGPNGLVLQAHPNGETIRIEIGDTAHRQLAEKVGIPFDYYNRMRAGQPDLLATNVNRWLMAEPGRHLLRMLTPITDEDGRRMTKLGAKFRLRAVLSSKFRILDTSTLLSTLLPVAASHGASVTSFDLSDDRFHMRIVGADRTTAGVGEVVRTGIAIANSETGFSSLAVDPFAEILRCKNGMIAVEKFRQIHAGRTKEEGFLSAETIRLEDAAVFLRVRDKAEELFGDESFRRIERAIEAGTTNALALPPELPMFAFLGNVGQTFDLTEKEIEILKEETVKDLSAGRYEAGFNQFSVAQGVTALARRVGDVDFDRRTELEKMGWEILVSPVEKLLKAGKAGTN